MAPSQVISVDVTMKNTGTTAWTAANSYSLGGVGDSDPFASARQLLDAGDSIGPGQQKTFTFNMTAPSTTGTYATDWQMVRDGVGWFGQVLSKNVVVAVPPAITVQPQSQTVLEGANVTFSVTATGAGTLSYQWQKNSVNISGATSRTLQLDNVQASTARATIGAP